MRLQKLVLFVAALMFLATSAYAQNRVEVKVTSEPIKEDSTCDKAGGFTLQFDPGTTIDNGDTITMDTTLNTVLCKNVDLYLVNGDSSATAGSMQWANATGGPIDNANSNANYFRVTGVAGTQRVTVTYTGAPISVTNAPDSFFLIKFLEQSENVDVVLDGNSTAAGFQGPPFGDATVSDNTLCIDVSNPLFTDSVVRGSMDSAADKFTFQPSDPQIAHIAQKDVITLLDCGKDEIGRVCMGGIIPGQTTTDNCDRFDYDGAGAMGATISLDNIWDPTTTGGDVNSPAANRLIMRSQPGFEASTQYFVEMSIIVNDEEGVDNGIYFAEDTAGIATEPLASSLDTLCSASAAPVQGTFYRANGVTGTPLLTADACTVPNANNRVIKFVSDVGGNMVISNAAELIKLDVPAMRYDIDAVSNGDVIKLKVVLKKAPCSTVTTQIITIAVIGCPAAQGVSDTLIYPYFTQAGGDDWWDGIVITNVGSTAGTATLTFYEQDGDAGTYTTPVVAGNSLYVNLLENILPMITQTAGTGTLGDSPVWVKAVTTFNADGFAMIAEGDNAFDSMGYLPRNAYDYK